jgi:predicted TIM-barrel fold metal-dependent hydrolase
VQTHWARERYEDEAAWVQKTAEATGWPHAIVAYADFTEPDVRPQLDRLARYRLVRGARMQLHWHQNPLYRFAARRDLAKDPLVERNVGRLADYGFSFDLQVFAAQMPDAADLVEACPKVTFVLQHAGMPEDLTGEGSAEWRAGMVRLAACPNVVAKLSGLGTFIHANDPAHVAEIVRETVGVFGAERCLFGSNFPIEKLWTSGAALVEAYRKAAGSLGERDRQAIFHDTAMRVYRIA